MEITLCAADLDAMGTRGFGGPPCCGDWYNDIDDEGDGQVCVILEEANYACREELEKAAAAGILFHGRHGCGGDYGAEEFVSDGASVTYADTDIGGELTMLYSGNAASRRAELSRVRRFLAVMKRVRGLMLKRGKERSANTGDKVKGGARFDL